MKKLVYFILFLWLQQFSFAQHDLYVGGELMGGIMGGTELNNTLLGQKNYSPRLGGQLSVNFRMFDRIAIEAGIGQHWSRVKLRDDDFSNEVDDFSINLKNTNMYWNYYAAISSFFRIKKTDSYIYGKFAVSQNIYSAETISAQNSFEISSQDIDRTLDFTTNYTESNISFIPEIGIQHKFYKGNLLSLGFRYNLGQSQVFESTYTITDNVTQQTKTDDLSSNGKSVALTVGFHYRLRHFDKKEKVKKFKPEDIAIDVTKKEPTEILDRDLAIRDKITVHSGTVKIIIWDHQTEDGDIVSLNLNNEWILENYELKNEKYEFEVQLREGLNTFVLHALNLGRIKPNTAALIVDDGEKKHRITLQSDFKESGTLQIKYKK